MKIDSELGSVNEEQLAGLLMCPFPNIEMIEAIPAPNHPPENISGYAAYYLAKTHNQEAYKNDLYSDYHLFIFKKLLEIDSQFASNDDQLAYCLKYSPTLKFIQVKAPMLI